MLASVSTTEGRRRRVDGRDAEAEDDRRRPALSVFMPDRLALVKGPPAPRRAHLDRLAAALWPARAELAPDYSRALAQRNALIGRIRRGGEQRAARGLGPRARRRAPCRWSRRAPRPPPSWPSPSPQPPRRSASSGMPSFATGRQPASSTLRGSPPSSPRAARRPRPRLHDLGPAPRRGRAAPGGRAAAPLRVAGPAAPGLLALLFAEREALRRARRTLPLMLLDDVMSELDPERRRRLVEAISAGGQVLITATEAEHVPAARRSADVRESRSARARSSRWRRERASAVADRRPLGDSLARVLAESAPRTLLAEVQAAWPRPAGRRSPRAPSPSPSALER